MIDPVDRDLNEHLNKLDLEQDRAEAADALVDEWMEDEKKVREALEQVIQEDLTDCLQSLTTAISNKNPDVRQKAETRVVGWFYDAVRQYFAEQAPEEIERREQQADMDAAEDREERRQMWMEDPMPGEY